MLSASAFLVLLTAIQYCSGRVLNSTVGPSPNEDGKVQALIVGGSAAPANRYPYATYVIFQTGNAVGQCSGSLIAPRVVLTAAHCLFPGATFYVSIGAYRRVLDDATRQKADLRRVVAAVAYPGFDTRVEEVQSNDLGLLLLDKASTKRPVKLARASAQDPRAGKPLMAIGWGATQPFSDVTSYILKQDIQPVFPRPVCSRIYSIAIDKRIICTGGEDGQGTCVGDSGGPLLQLGRSAAADIAVGVLSFGNQPCGYGGPSGYTSVALFRPWIEKTIKKWGQKLR